MPFSILITGFSRSIPGTRAAPWVLCQYADVSLPDSRSRFAPYVFAGGGGIFGGGEKTRLVASDGVIRTEETDPETELIGQFGGGVEVRITPHIGWINDFSWNVVNGSENNFWHGAQRSQFRFLRLVLTENRTNRQRQ